MIKTYTIEYYKEISLQYPYKLLGSSMPGRTSKTGDRQALGRTGMPAMYRRYL